MNYSEVLNLLYSSSRDNLIYSSSFGNLLYLLNQSRYVLDDLNLKLGDAALHTGFIFKTSNEELVELFYCLKNKIIFRQPHQPGLSPPALNGLVCYRSENNYYNEYDGTILSRIQFYDSCGVHNETFLYEKLVKIEENNVLEPLNISILTEDGKGVLIKRKSLEVKINSLTIEKYCLQNINNSKIHYNGSTFRKYLPILYFDSQREDYDDRFLRKDEVMSMGSNADIYYSFLETIEFIPIRGGNEIVYSKEVLTSSYKKKFSKIILDESIFFIEILYLINSDFFRCPNHAVEARRHQRYSDYEDYRERISSHNSNLYQKQHQYNYYSVYEIIELTEDSREKAIYTKETEKAIYTKETRFFDDSLSDHVKSLSLIPQENLFFQQLNWFTNLTGFEKYSVKIINHIKNSDKEEESWTISDFNKL